MEMASVRRSGPFLDLTTSPQGQEQSILTVLPTSNPTPTMEPRPTVN